MAAIGHHLHPMRNAFEFCLPTPAKVVPAGPDWIHEIKYDGYCLRVERNGKSVRLFTRNGHNWTKLSHGSPRPLSRTASNNSPSTARLWCSALAASPTSTPCTHAGTRTRLSSLPARRRGSAAAAAEPA
ncbi:hypothetical protein ABIF65_006614 [Bradyrhizobium japonicum]|nr:hypothetical protein [Bradyrhizobium japonicum]MCP1964465.1 hypothetical protein [Bradyrhizobium japonicum]